MTFNIYWIPWLIGIMVPFGFKLGHHLWQSEANGVSFTKAILQFVFADAAASTTTVVTFAGELMIGAWYIDRLPLPFVPEVMLPQHWAVCFFLALIAEGIVPIIVKGIYGWVEAKVQKLRS